MPHQCLQCGEVFEELTDEILFNGCPKCGGKRFTFTNTPMTDEERMALLEKREEEIKGIIRRAAEMPVEETVEKGEEKEFVEFSEAEAIEVINVKESGVYEINIERLLDDYPIIINQDGSYTVYLPSVFRKKKKARKERK